MFILSQILIANIAVANPTAEEVEAAVLKARRSILKGKISVETKLSTEKGTRDNERKHTVWFDFEKDQFRSDAVHMDKGKDGPFPRHIMGINCEQPNTFIDYTPIQTAHMVTAMSLKPLTSELRKSATEIIDVRLLGLRPYYVINNYTLENTLERADRKPPELKQEKWKGKDCSVISYVDLTDRHYELWVVPSEGYSVVRFVGYGTNAKSGKPWRDVVETEYQRVGNTGIWYPQSWTTEISSDGKTRNKEEGRVTEVSINEPVDEKVFTLAGMNIDRGTVIASQQPNGKSKALEWTGEEVVKHVNPPMKPTPLQVESSKRGWMIYTAVGLAMLMTLALVLFWRRGRVRGA